MILQKIKKCDFWKNLKNVKILIFLKKMCEFDQILAIFTPLFHFLRDSDPDLAKFLTEVGGFDSVDDESLLEFFEKMQKK